MTSVTPRRRSAPAADHSTSGSAAEADHPFATRRTPQANSALEVSRRAHSATRQHKHRRIHLEARRSRDVETFFTTHGPRLRRIVTSRLTADQHTIEDACQHAWAALAHDAHVTLDQRGLAWLTRVALREGWRLTGMTRRELPASPMVVGETTDGDPVDRRDAHAGAEEEALGRLEHRDRVRDLLALKRRERRDLFLQACGYRYTEIAAITGSTYTGVNRRLAEGRAELRRLERTRSRDPASSSAACSAER